jgi:molecular chaperone DnaK (HSP70)
MAAKLDLSEDCTMIEELTVLDVTPINLGVEVIEGRMSVVIPAFTSFPICVSKIFHTSPGQPA